VEYAILKNKFFHEEVVPGTPREYEVVHKLRELFSEFSDWVKLVDTPTSSWVEHECFIEVENTVVKCHAMPYVDRVEVDGRIIWGSVVDGRLVLSGDVDGAVVFTPFPKELEEVKYIALELAKRGAVAAVFYDEERTTYRRVVLTGSETYSFNYGSPPPIPVVSVLLSDVARYRKSAHVKARVFVDARTRHGLVSKTIMAGVNGSGESEIHVTAHHDHWFTGFSDNLVGLEAVYQLIRRAREWRGANIVFISFSSEEIGAPNYAGWYWAWGSRYYLRLLREKNMVEGIIANINIDALYRYPLELYGNPSLKACVDSIVGAFNAVYKGFDHTDFDSFSYTLQGVPAITITTISNLRPVYHSSIDIGVENDPNIVSSAVELAWKLVECINRERPRYKLLVDYIKERLGDQIPLEGKILVSKLENIHKLLGDERKSIELATRSLTRVVYIPGLELKFTADLLADVITLTDLATIMPRYAGKTLQVYSLDRKILSAVVTYYNMDKVRELLVDVIAELLREANNVLEEELTLLTYSKLLLERS